MCVINGASLFTSNIAYMAAAFIQRKSSAGQALWIIWLSYFTNLAGGCRMSARCRRSQAYEMQCTYTCSIFTWDLCVSVACQWCSSVLPKRLGCIHTCCHR